MCSYGIRDWKCLKVVTKIRAHGFNSNWNQVISQGILQKFLD